MFAQFMWRGLPLELVATLDIENHHLLPETLPLTSKVSFLLLFLSDLSLTGSSHPLSESVPKSLFFFVLIW